MAVELVEIVNPNGRKGRVPTTSAAAAQYKRPPGPPPVPTQPVGDTPPANPTTLEQPAGNASTEAWQAYASHPNTPNGLSSEQAAEMTRDQLVDHFTNTSQED